MPEKKPDKKTVAKSDAKGPAMGAIDDMLAFTREKFVSRYCGYAKFMLLGLLLMGLGIGVMIGLGTGLGLIGLGIGVVLAIVLIFVAEVLMLGIINYVDNEANGRPSSVWELAKKNALPVLKLAAVFIAFEFIFGAVLVGTSIIPCCAFVAYIAFYAILLAAMFTPYELLINRLGVIGSIKSSVDKVKENAVSFIGFLVASILVLLPFLLLIGIAMYAAIGGSSAFDGLKDLENMPPGDGAAVMGALMGFYMKMLYGMAIAYIVTLPLMPVFGLLQQSLTYYFWKRIGK